MKLNFVSDFFEIQSKPTKRKQTTLIQFFYQHAYDDFGSQEEKKNREKLIPFSLNGGIRISGCSRFSFERCRPNFIAINS